MRPFPERLAAQQDRIVTRGRIGAEVPDPELLEAAQFFHHYMLSMQGCLQWASCQRIGPGGIAHSEISKLMSAAARGDDWKALRDQALTGRRR